MHSWGSPPSIHGFKVVPSTFHQCLYCLVNEIVASDYSVQDESRISYQKVTQLAKPRTILVQSKEEVEGKRLQTMD